MELKALAWDGCSSASTKAERWAGLIGSGDELVTTWRRMLPRVLSIRLFGGYGIVGARRYTLSWTYQGTFAPGLCHTASIARSARDGSRKAEQTSKMQSFNAAAD